MINVISNALKRLNRRFGGKKSAQTKAARQEPTKRKGRKKKRR